MLFVLMNSLLRGALFALTNFGIVRYARWHKDKGNTINSIGLVYGFFLYSALTGRIVIFISVIGRCPML